MNIASDNVSEAENLTWKELHAINFAFDAPFRLPLAEDQTFLADQVVRVLPRKRIVAFGMWQDKYVVAKLFFDPKHAKRHLEKEVEGFKLLRENRIPTPPLYYKGVSSDGRVQVLLFERIFDAKTLDEIWKTRESTDELLPVLKATIIELATQHVLGVMQKDLHLKNFLLTRKTIFTLDGGQVELFPYLLPKKQSMENLALFLAQFGSGFEKYQETLFRFYAKSRGWLLKPEDIVELRLMIKKCNDDRWSRYAEKIFRDCTDFAEIRQWRMRGMYDRAYTGEAFLQFLQDPESAFNHPSMTMLKAGRSTTVIKVVLDDRTFVVKRYNIKNFWTKLRRSFRMTRAAKSWRLAQKLCLFGIATAKPVAYLERRSFNFRGKSYYVTEYIEGKHLGEYLEYYQGIDGRVDTMVANITELLRGMSNLELTHGDLKMTNILIDEEQRPVFIDLDGTAEHFSLAPLRSAWRKEIKRFLRNFDHLPAIQEKFKIAFTEK